MDTKRLSLPSSIHTDRAKELINDLQRRTMKNVAADEAGLLEDLFASFKELFSFLAKPMFKRRHLHRGSIPSSKVLNDSFKEAESDIRLLHKAQQTLSEAVVRHFNYSQTISSRLYRMLQTAGKRMNDYMVMAKNTIRRIITFQERFISKDMIDITDAHLDTQAGTLSLRIVGSKDHSQECKVVKRSYEEPAADPSYSMPGNWFVAFKRTQTISEKLAEHVTGIPVVKNAAGEWSFYHDIDEKDDLDACLDGNPDTWFEWQMINVPEEAKRNNPPKGYPNTKGYGWNFDDGTPIFYGDPDKDELKLRLTIELPQERTLNWVSLSPYFFEGFEGYLMVDKIETSRDGISFLPLPIDGPSSIGVSDTLVAPLDFPDREKYRGQGAWSFPGRPARFVRFHLRSPKAYQATLGHIYWTVSYVVEHTHRFLGIQYDRTHTYHTERVQGPAFPREAFRDRHARLKTYTMEGAAVGAIASFAFSLGPIGVVLGAILGFLSSTSSKVKHMSDPQVGWDIYTDGWRWSIGVRQIGLYTYTYAESSAMTSKAFIVPQGVRTVSLSVDEEIPEEFYANDLSTKNEWIRYYVSSDGNTWHRISPLEHTPIEGAEFYPKVYSAQPGEAPAAGSGERGYFNEDGPVTRLYVKIEISRPHGERFEMMTPVVHGYTLNILPKEIED